MGGERDSHLNIGCTVWLEYYSLRGKALEVHDDALIWREIVLCPNLKNQAYRGGPKDTFLNDERKLCRRDRVISLTSAEDLRCVEVSQSKSVNVPKRYE